MITKHYLRADSSIEKAVMPVSSVFMRLVTVFAVCVYGFCLKWIYIQLVPSNAYLGWSYEEPNVAIYRLAFCLVALLSILMPLRLNGVADYVLWWLFLTVVVPSILLGHFTGHLGADVAWTTSFIVSGCWLMVLLLTRWNSRAGVRLPRPTPQTFWLVVACQSFISYFLLGATGTLSVEFLNVYDVYSVRSNFVETTKGNLFIGYWLPIQYHVLNPLLIALGLRLKRLAFSLSGVVGQLILYASLGHKTILLSIPLIFGIYLLFRKRRAPAALSLVGVFTALPLGLWLVDSWFRISDGFSGLVTRRFLLVPGFLTVAYVWVFTGRPKTLFYELFPWASSPYDQNAANLVMGELTGSLQSAANVNFLGHGFASAGYFGMFIESALVAVLILVIASFVRDVPTGLGVCIFAMPAMAVSESSIFVALLTHGSLAALVWCRLVPMEYLHDGRLRSPPWGSRAASCHRNGRNAPI